MVRRKLTPIRRFDNGTASAWFACNTVSAQLTALLMEFMVCCRTCALVQLRFSAIQGEIMFRKLYLSLVLILFVAPAVLAETADDIVAKHIEAMGGQDKIQAVKTMKMTGTMQVQEGLEAPITMLVKVPDQVRMEFTIQGLTAVQAYDGKNGWDIMPFTGKKDPEAMSGDDVKELQDQADIWPCSTTKPRATKSSFWARTRSKGPTLTS